MGEQGRPEDIWGYLLLISPDNKTSFSIMKIKKLFKEKYGCASAERSYPHLTLIKFQQYQDAEHQIIRHFERFSRSVVPFDIVLNGFGSFPAHTIYVNIATFQPVADLVKNMRHTLGPHLRTKTLARPVFVTNPHVTIGRKMDRKQYEQAWEEWKSKGFNSSFAAEKMLLLRKQPGAQRYEVVQQFRFAGTACQGTQGTLF